MTKTKLTKREIVNETILHIKEHGRAINASGDCMYLSEDGQMCAIGRCMKAKARYKYREGSKLQELTANSIDLESVLKKKYRGHPVQFWTALQSLHDEKVHWTTSDDGLHLSKYGLELYRRLVPNNDTDD